MTRLVDYSDSESVSEPEPSPQPEPAPQPEPEPAPKHIFGPFQEPDRSEAAEQEREEAFDKLLTRALLGLGRTLPAAGGGGP